ncbi:hypothetical protein Dda_0347 [Drechslerella dactyloides]|uniref:Uncharacterized protein n=1 Tax=Drechslerella dactyloides TaxID=74499 RepID=A0AAD6NML0_DREDA|nr:hypothetical protein Dda_0347 [Drechslerella dactyloides]
MECAGSGQAQNLPKADTGRQAVRSKLSPLPSRPTGDEAFEKHDRASNHSPSDANRGGFTKPGRVEMPQDFLKENTNSIL